MYPWTFAARSIFATITTIIAVTTMSALPNMLDMGLFE
jgi:hypothetical protein